MTLSRRGFLSGIGSMLAAPAIVHAGNLMPVKVVDPMLDRLSIGILGAGSVRHHMLIWLGGGAITWPDGNVIVFGNRLLTRAL